MTRYTQTHNLTASDHIKIISKYAGVKPNFTIINKEKISKHIQRYYAQEHEYPVKNDLNTSQYQIIAKDLISEVKQKKNDMLKRSLLRHDDKKLAKTIVELL